MEFGVFHKFPRLPGQSEAEAFADGLALVDAAERWGLDVLWLAELQLSTTTVLASPLAIAAAIAGRTERVRIGTAVQVLPLGDPLRLAEEWATVDQISRGRLIFGTGRSSSPRSYQAYGIPYGESRARFAEVLAIIRQAWTEPSFSVATLYRIFGHPGRFAPASHGANDAVCYHEGRNSDSNGLGGRGRGDCSCSLADFIT